MFFSIITAEADTTPHKTSVQSYAQLLARAIDLHYDTRKEAAIDMWGKDGHEPQLSKQLAGREALDLHRVQKLKTLCRQVFAGLVAQEEGLETKPSDEEMASAWEKFQEYQLHISNLMNRYQRFQNRK